MGRILSLSIAILTLFLITNLLTSTNCQSLSIVSSSTTVGDTSVNYTFILTNFSSLTTISFNFASWSYLTYNPYSASSRCYLFTSAITTTSFPSNQIQCSMTATGINQSINITITNMINPSSTKPYQINVTLTNSTNSVTLSRTLTVSNVPNYPLTFKSYSRVVGATSSSITIDIIMSNYIDPSTVLNLNFNSTLINISIPTTSTYISTQTTSGIVNINTWSNLQSFANQITLSNVAITNPLAAITYTVSGLFYFIQGNVIYNIQTVSATLVLTPTSFNSIIITSPLQYGLLSTLSIASSCNFSQVNSTNTSNPAYTIVDYPTQLKPTSSSDCVITSNTTCQHVKSTSSYTLNNFQVSIGNFTTLTLIFTSYTFYKGSYYSLCRLSTSVSITYQSVTPFIITSECDTTITSLSNTINLYLTAQSILTGDIVYITGMKGVITNSWSQTIVSGISQYKQTLLATNIASNGTITIPLHYNNPNQTITNSITQLTIFRSTNQYISSTISLTLCPITTGRTVDTYTVIPSSFQTYNIISMSFGLTMQIYDYAYNDYFIIQFNSIRNSRQYFLAGSLIGITPNLTVNGIYCTFSIVNDYTLNITLNNNVVLPSVNSPTLTIVFTNLVNPPAIDNYWLIVTTFDGPTVGTKQILTTSQLTIRQNVEIYSISNVSVLKNNSITLSIANSNRMILSKNNSSASTTIKIVFPSTLTCSSLSNNTVNVNWNVGILTSNGVASGTTTNLQINLGSCYVSYFSNNISFTIIQTFNTISSTSTQAFLYNKCGSTCYECSTAQCTSCFNSTYTTLNYYWLGSCNSACPSGSYTSDSSCLACHSSCQTCVGPSYNNCTSCSQNFTLYSSGYCGSVCGSGKYESNGACLSCHANCDSCLSSTVCYVCKISAILIGVQCQFSSCTSPCSTCFGSLTTCTSCITPKILYQSQCYDSCPSGTYQSKSGGVTSCSVINESSTYIPVTITGIILLIIVIILRAYSSKKIGNESRRRQSYVQNENEINYKINILRVASVIFSFLELIAAIVLVLKNSTYGVGSSSITAVIIGLIIHLLCNIAFVVGFVRIVGTKILSSGEQNNNYPQQSNFYIRYRAIFILSAFITFRSYKLLSANIFLDRKSSSQVKLIGLEQTDNQINNTKPQQPIRIKSSAKQEQIVNNNLKQQVANSNIKNIKISQEQIPSRKPIRSNSLGDQNPYPVIQSTISIKIQGPRQKQNRFTHPFLTYLTIISIIGATVPIIAGCILQIMKYQFVNMLFWGVDCLIVSICSLGMIAWDLWIFANLFHNQQHSQMSSKEGEVNHTHQNLKQLAQFQIKIQPEKQEVKPLIKSPKRFIGNSTKRSQNQKVVMDKQESLQGVRSGIKRECDQQTVARHQNLPALKVFDDFDEKDDNILSEKKTKKFSTKNLKNRNSSRKRYPVSNRRKNANGQVCDDLYINFAANERETQHNATSFLRTKNSPNRSLQEQSIEVGGEFEDQPPNFADISDIQQGHQAINISMSSELVHNKLRPQPKGQ